MSNFKQKKTTGQPPPTRASTISSKLAQMATASNEANVTQEGDGNSGDLSMDKLIAELAKQRTSLKEDMSTLIQDSITPLQASVDALHETVNSFQRRLTRVETTAGENFENIAKAEAVIRKLETDNATLLDRVDDLENRSRRSNLRIINVPEGSEDGQEFVQFVSKMLMEVMGPDVFDGPLELERAHRSLISRAKRGAAPRTIMVCFHRFQDKERALRWARQHELCYRNNILRFYPDFSAALSKKRAAFNGVKTDLYRKGVRFSLLHPARLRVTLGNGETLTFNTAEEAKAFYTERFK